MKAIDLDFTGQKFSPKEFPAGSLEWLDANVILALFDIRNNLPSDAAMFPSPLLGGHVRHNRSTSRHSTLQRTQLSTATDVFIRWENVWEAITEAYKHPLVGGLGIYTDNMLRGVRGDFAMLHIDIRPKSEFIQWVGWRLEHETKMRYTYFRNNPREFLSILLTRGKYA